jgi:cob(I)alamin adenosyltransferase
VTRIYTKTGDTGTTGLIGGGRVPKDSPFIEACGSLDELNALLGVLRSKKPDARIDQVLLFIQDDLFSLGAALAASGQASKNPFEIHDDFVKKLEQEIDAFEIMLDPLKQLIMPGGSASAAELHLARAVARRAERCCVSLAKIVALDSRILQYLNRLSDLLFVMARFANRSQSISELHPTFGKRPAQ